MRTLLVSLIITIGILFLTVWLLLELVIRLTKDLKIRENNISIIRKLQIKDVLNILEELKDTQNYLYGSSRDNALRRKIAEFEYEYKIKELNITDTNENV